MKKKHTGKKKQGNNQKIKKNGSGLNGAQKKKKVRQRMQLGLVLLSVILIALVVIKIVKPSLLTRNYFEMENDKVDASKPDIDVELLTVNPYSRPGTETGKIRGIVVHYTANPGATAIANRNYFEGLKDSHQTKSSSNFIVGIDGEIVQCVPTWEVAYASNERNIDTVSIECCHPDESGKYNEATYDSLVKLTAWLCKELELTSDDVIRHYDVNEKGCPRYFVEHPDAWTRFLADIEAELAQ